MDNNNNLFKYYGLTLFILFFILFPFGQLLRFETLYKGVYLVVHPIDIIAILSVPYLFLVKRGGVLKNLNEIVIIFIASFIFSLGIFKFDELPNGFLYLLRLISYFSFANMVFYLTKYNVSKEKILNVVSYSIFIFMIMGLYQFFYFYDLRDLFYVGWDDHFYRLTSTFFDPGFSASVLIIGLFLFIKRKLIRINILNYLIVLIFLLAIVLTFSRAGYLSLLLVTIYSFKKYIKQILFTFVLIIFVIFIIPKPHSSGVELYRTFSIQSRLVNYSDSLKTFIKYPLFGIGFNNYCIYKSNYLITDNIYSHSCSGSDSSLFLILATTGTAGIIVVIYNLYLINNDLEDNIYNDLLKIAFLSIVVGSFFNNNLFYNFLMGIMAVFIGVSENNSTMRI